MEGYTEERSKNELAERLTKAIVYNLGGGCDLVKTTLQVLVQNKRYTVTVEKAIKINLTERSL